MEVFRQQVNVSKEEGKKSFIWEKEINLKEIIIRSRKRKSGKINI